MISHPCSLVLTAQLHGKEISPHLLNRKIKIWYIHNVIYSAVKKTEITRNKIELENIPI